MKNNLLKTVIILIAVTFVTLQSCEKKGIVDIEDEKIENNILQTSDYEYQKEYSISNKTVGLNAKIIISADTKEELDFAADNIIIRPLYKHEMLRNENNNIQDNDDEFDNEKPKALIQLTEVKLPKGAIGYEIEGISSANKGWDDQYAYASWGIKTGLVKKTNSSGKVKVRIGILYTSSQWLYTNVLKSTIKGKNSTASHYQNPNTYYLMRVKVKPKKGGTYIIRFYH